MDVYRISAFADGEQGGNPAGVALVSVLPPASDMQRIAADIGYSETAFAAPDGDAWRVRYFSPKSEVPFCGHATIALGTALAHENGNGVFTLKLNESTITVEGIRAERHLSAALQSPATYSQAPDPALVSATLALFGLSANDLDDRIPVAFAHAGADHLLVVLRSRELLADMQYNQQAGLKLMNQYGLVTILLGYAESEQLFHTRNAFASGGVYEDPATGAATAALAGYLRDIAWPHGGKIDIVQGEDMGSRSLLSAEFSDKPGSSIRVSGSARFL